MKEGHILIVDDEKEILKHLKRYFCNFAEKVFTAEDGQEALDILLREDVHCVVSDIKMPRMSGIELIKEVRKKDMKIPFIFLTGHGSDSLMKEAINYAAFDFIDKPLDIDQLIASTKRGLAIGLDILKNKNEDLNKIMEVQITNEFAKAYSDSLKNMRRSSE